MVQMHLFAGQEERRRCREQTCRHKVEGQCGMNGEIGSDRHTLPCVKQIASGKLVCNRGSSVWCPVMI